MKKKGASSGVEVACDKLAWGERPVRSLGMLAPPRVLAFSQEANDRLFLYQGVSSQLRVSVLQREGDGSGDLRARLVYQEAVFEGAPICGLRLVNNSLVILWSNKNICVLQRERAVEDDAGEGAAALQFKVLLRMQLKDWIWDVFPLSSSSSFHSFLKPQHPQTLKEEEREKEEGDESYRCIRYLVVGYAHNDVEVWDWKNRTLLHAARSEPCILYSLSFHASSCSSSSSSSSSSDAAASSVPRLLVAAGTVFNKVLIWDVFSPIDDEGKEKEQEEGSNIKDGLVVPLFSLEGHKGVIFDICWSEEGRVTFLCTASDDRSARLWKLPLLSSDSSSDSSSSSSSVPLILSPLLSLWGHSARVWRTKLVHSHIITVSEDATCRVWDRHTGVTLATLRGHQGKNVWCMAEHRISSDDSLIVTGGGDCVLRMWSLKSAIEHHSGGRAQLFDIPQQQQQDQQQKKKRDFARRVILLDRKTLVAATDKGYVYKIPAIERREEETYQCLHFNGGNAIYESLLASPDSTMLLLGDDQGGLTLVSTTSAFPSLHWKGHEGKIRHLFWPRQSSFDPSKKGISFFTSSLFDKKLKWWILDPDESEKQKEEQTTRTPALYAVYSISQKAFACALDILILPSLQRHGMEAAIIVGDSAGSLHLFLPPSFSEEQEIKPTFSLIDAHRKEHISDLCIRSPDEIYSTSSSRQGSILHRYSFVFAPSSSSSPTSSSCSSLSSFVPKLEQKAAIKLTFSLETIERIFIERNDISNKSNNLSSSLGEGEVSPDLCLFGFHGSFMVMLHVATRAETLRIDCGRSKRGWDYFYDKSPNGAFALVYNGLKDKQLHVHSSSESEDLSTVFHQHESGQPFHARATNALLLLPSSSSSLLFVTGSNDTTAAVWRFDDDSEDEQKQQLTVHRQFTLRRHSSTVRAFAAVSVSTNDCLLFSGGGQRQLNCWKLQHTERREEEKEKELGLDNADEEHQRYKYDWICSYRSSHQASECRIMALSAFLSTHKREEPAETKALLVSVCVGYSDGKVEILVFDPQQNRFVDSLSRGLEVGNSHSAVLSMDYLSLPENSGYVRKVEVRGANDDGLLFVGFTDGKVWAWRTSSLCSSPQRRFELVAPTYKFAALHQSGVNVLSAAILPTTPPATSQAGEDSSVWLLLASGGDDQQLHVCAFPVPIAISDEDATEKKKETGEEEGPSCLLMDKVSVAHAAAIRGLKTDGSQVLTTGPDQRLNLWRVKNDLTSKTLKVEMEGSCFVDVADASCLDAVFHNDRITAAVAGSGLQVLQWATNK